jgi:hypothetical protein
MRYLAGFLAVSTLSLSAGAPFAAAQAAAVAESQSSVIGSTVLTPSQAQISGRVITPNGNPLANAMVRARNLINGQIGGSTSTASAGQFSMNVNPGSYLLEVVDGGGQILGTSPFISAAAGTAITAATVTVSTGALGAVTTTTGLLATLGSTAARSLTYAAAAAGVAGVVSAPEVVTASPSR